MGTLDNVELVRHWDRLISVVGLQAMCALLVPCVLVRVRARDDGDRVSGCDC